MQTKIQRGKASKVRSEPQSVHDCSQRRETSAGLNHLKFLMFKNKKGVGRDSVCELFVTQNSDPQHPHRCQAGVGDPYIGGKDRIPRSDLAD